MSIYSHSARSTLIVSRRTMKHTFIATAVLFQGAILWQPAAAQLTLGGAMQLADRSAYGNRIASGATAERQAQSLAAM